MNYNLQKFIKDNPDEAAELLTKIAEGLSKNYHFCQLDMFEEDDELGINKLMRIANGVKISE